MQLKKSPISIAIFLLTFIVAVGLIGCTRATKLGNPKYMPDNWLAINSSAWQVKQLPEVNRIELENLQIKLYAERQGQYFNFFGKYRPEVLYEIEATTKRLDQAYLDLQYSSRAILASLTPGLDGLSETDAEREAGIAVVNNVNQRMSKDDINRALLLDKPSMLSPYPVVDH